MKTVLNFSIIGGVMALRMEDSLLGPPPAYVKTEGHTPTPVDPEAQPNQRVGAVAANDPWCCYPVDCTTLDCSCCYFLPNDHGCCCIGELLVITSLAIFIVLDLYFLLIIC